MNVARLGRSVFCMLLCAGLFAGGAQTAQAQAFDVKKIQELPSFPIDRTVFENQTELHTEQPLNDKFLSYTVRLPKGWKKIPNNGGQSQDVSKRLLGEIARYYSPIQGDLRSRFTVMTFELDREITARNWLLHYILSRGYSLEGMKELSDRKAEAVYLELEKDTPYVVRVVAETNGPRMALSMMYIPERLWKGQEGLQEAILKTFTFLSPEDTTIEPVQTFAFLDLLRFDYPSSWVLRAPSIQSMDIMDARIVNMANEKTLNGEINVNLVSTELDTTLAEEVKALQKELDERGMVIGAMIEQPTDYKFQPQVYYSRVEAYEMTNKDKTLLDHEYWVAVLIEDRYYCIVTMLTPSRNVDFYTWASNTEAFDRVIETIRP